MAFRLPVPGDLTLKIFLFLLMCEVTYLLIAYQMSLVKTSNDSPLDLKFLFLKPQSSLLKTSPCSGNAKF